MSLTFTKLFNKYTPPKENMVNSLKLTTSLFVILLLIMAAFFQDSLFRMGHMTFLRLLRSFFFTWAVFALLPSVLDWPCLRSPAHKNKIASCALYTIFWIGIYTIAFARISNSLQSDIGNYYILPCLLFSVQLFYITGISRVQKHLRFLLSFMYTVGLFSLFLFALFYVSYLFIYGQPFDEYALLSIIATNPDEIVNYLTATFSLSNLLLISTLIISVFIFILWNTYKVTTEPYIGYAPPEANNCSFRCNNLFLF